MPVLPRPRSSRTLAPLAVTVLGNGSVSHARSARSATRARRWHVFGTDQSGAKTLPAVITMGCDLGGGVCASNCGFADVDTHGEFVAFRVLCVASSATSAFHSYRTWLNRYHFSISARGQTPAHLPQPLSKLGLTHNAGRSHARRFALNPIVGGNSANRKSSPGKTRTCDKAVNS